jgi:hypothetical protein
LASAWPRSLTATSVTGNLTSANGPAGLKHKLRSELLRLKECRDRSPVISSVGVATGNVDQQMCTPLK